MPTLVSTGQITLTDVTDGLNARLSSESHLIPTDSNGENGDYSGCSTTLSVFLGKTDDTANWSFSASPTAGITGSLVGSTYTVTGMTTDAGYVDLTASRQGYASLTSRFSITKAKRGHAGPAITLVSSAQGFVFRDNLPFPTNQSIAFTVIRQNAYGPVQFYASNGVSLTTDAGQLLLSNYTLGVHGVGEGETCYLDLAQFGDNQQVTITAVVGEQTATQTIVRLDSSTAEAGATVGAPAGTLVGGQLAEQLVSDAATAKLGAETANNLLADIASDSKLTATEKQQVKLEWDVLVAEKAGINAQATAFGITTENTSYNSAYDALNAYVTPLLSSLTTTSDITGSTFRTNFSNLYSARQALLNKIAEVAATRSNWDSVSNKPTDEQIMNVLVPQGVYNQVPLPYSGRNLLIPCYVNNDSGTPGWFRIAELKINGFYHSCNLMGAIYWGQSDKRFNYRADFKAFLEVGGSVSVISNYGFRYSGDNLTGVLKLRRYQDVDNSWKLGVFVYLNAWSSALLDGSWFVNNAAGSWIDDFVTNIDKLPGDPGYTDIVPTANYELDANKTYVDSNGNIQGVSSGSGQSVANNMNSVIRAPGGGVFTTSNATMTGRLKITLPQSWTSTMMRFTVDIFEYTTGYSCTLEISGYNYSSGIPAWHQVSAAVLGGSNVEYPVYFGHDGTKCCVWIGATTGETWSYPQVRVRDWFGGFSNFSRAQWESGWVIGFDTTAITAGTGANKYSAVVSDTLPGANWAKISGSNKPADGATRNVHRGNWANATSYALGDTVIYGGYGWSCILAHTSATGTNNPPTYPTTSNTWWTLAAVKGEDAKTAMLTASSFVFKVAQDGTVSPASIALTAVGQNLAGDPTFTVTSGTAVLTGTGQARVLNAASLSTDQATIKITWDGKEDYVTITKVREGASALSVVMSNEAHALPASNTGTVSSYTGSGTTIEVFEGGTALTASASATVSAFRVGTVTVSPVGKLTPGSVSYAGTKATLADHSAMDAATDAVVLTIPLTVYRADGSSVSLTKVQTLTKAKAGAAGATGAAGAAGLNFSEARPLFSDPTFQTGTNGASVYNNFGGGAVTVTREARQADSPYTDSGYNLKISNTGSASPGLGGFVQLFNARASAVFVQRIVAKIPVGYTIEQATNAMGDGATNTWITSKAGTGKFEEYLLVRRCGATGTFSMSGHAYITGTVGTPGTPVNWYLAYAGVYDFTSLGFSNITAILSNETHTITTDSAGNNGNYSGASTTLTVFNGTTDDSANWSVAATPSGVTGSLVGKTYTVTAMSGDTGYVDLVASRAGYANVTKRFTLSKSRAGVAGAAGVQGPSVSVVSDRVLAFTATDGTLDAAQADIVFTANLSGIASPTYVWTFSGFQTAPTNSGAATQTITAAQFGTAKAATVTCTVNGTFVDRLTIVRLEKSTAAAGATVGGTLGENIAGQITPENASALIATAAIGAAHIQNAAIGNAKIAEAAVDTLKIAGNAVTLPISVTNAGKDATTGAISVADYAVFTLWGYCQYVRGNTFGYVPITGALKYTNVSTGAVSTIVSWVIGVTYPNEAGAASMAGRVTLAPGTYTFSFELTLSAGGVTFTGTTLTALGCMR